MKGCADKNFFGLTLSGSMPFRVELDLSTHDA
jgi:hypothetical protein